jgi:hypothetical protein
MMAVMATKPRLRDPVIRRADSGFEVWADEYVPNQPSAVSTARLRRLIADELRALPAPDGRVLHAGYGGWRWHGTDVENLLFNNIDQGLSLFHKPGRAGVRFEDFGLTVPDQATLLHYGERRARLCQPVAVKALLCGAVWGWRAGGGEAHQGSGGRGYRGHAARRARPGNRDGSPTGEAAGCHCRRLLGHAIAASAPLGARSRSHLSSRESLFTLHGSAAVRVTPDDDRCIAAEVTTAGHDGLARLSVEVYSAHPPSGAGSYARLSGWL